MAKENSNPTSEQIATWATSGKVFEYEVDGKRCWLKRPNRQTIVAASVKGKDDPFKFAEVILANCWLGGDEELRTDDAYFMGLAQQVSELVEVKVGKLKKL